MTDNDDNPSPTQPESLPCMLLPVVGSTLLLPKAVIAEMAMVSPVEDVASTPVWFEGYYYWRDQKIPIISYERLNGRSRYPLNPLGRVAVLHTSGEYSAIPFIAFSTQGIPTDITISPKNISQANSSNLAHCEELIATVGLNAYTIPNMSVIEAEVNKVLSGLSV